MQISILLMEQIIQLFLMIFMGYVLVKAKLLKSSDSKGISIILLYLVVPCVILHAFQVKITSDVVQGLLLAFAASLLLQVLLLVITLLLKKPMKFDDVEVGSIYYSNAGNLIVPIVTYVLGEKWVIYACVFMSMQVIFIWTHGKHLLSREKKTDWKNIFLNVNMISIAVGLLLFFTGIRLPKIADAAMSSVGALIGPLSMFVTGMLIAGMDLKKAFRNPRVYLITFFRLIILPLIALGLLRISGLAGWDENGSKILLITYLAVITPSASTVTQMCQVYGGDSQYASLINVMTTLFSILTMPLMVMAFQTFI